MRMKRWFIICYVPTLRVNMWYISETAHPSISVNRSKDYNIKTHRARRWTQFHKCRVCAMQHTWVISGMFLVMTCTPGKEYRDRYVIKGIAQSHVLTIRNRLKIWQKSMMSFLLPLMFIVTVHGHGRFKIYLAKCDMHSDFTRSNIKRNLQTN